jgi:protein required for attachment to host cells
MIHAIVADTRTVRVFEGSPARAGLTEVAVFRNQAAGQHERDLVSDRPGRIIHGSSGAHTAYEPKVPASRLVMQAWLKAIGPSLRDLLETRSSESIVLVASPRMLAQLRKALPAAVSKRVAAEVRLDLAQQPLGELQKRLLPALRAAAVKQVRTARTRATRVQPSS